MSSGPFVIESWSKGTEVSYVKNENYLHADEIYLDGINVRVIADESTRLELFEKGELDFLTLGTTGQAQYGDDPRVCSAACWRACAAATGRGCFREYSPMRPRCA